MMILIHFAIEFFIRYTLIQTFHANSKWEVRTRKKEFVFKPGVGRIKGGLTRTKINKWRSETEMLSLTHFLETVGKEYLRNRRRSDSRKQETYKIIIFTDDIIILAEHDTLPNKTKEQQRSCIVRKISVKNDEKELL